MNPLLEIYHQRHNGLFAVFLYLRPRSLHPTLCLEAGLTAEEVGQLWGGN